MDTQETSTPWEFFRAVEKECGITFTYDMAASSENAKCENFFTKEQNSLKMPWPLGEWCWLNPPFGQVGVFAEKCYRESKRGCDIVSIWPLSGDLNQIVTWTNSSVFIVHGRIWPLVRSCMLCLWGVRRPTVMGLRWNKVELERIW